MRSVGGAGGRFVAYKLPQILCRTGPENQDEEGKTLRSVGGVEGQCVAYGRLLQQSPYRSFAKRDQRIKVREGKG
eukprot:1162062-Pelagomonas_calceolata.AAC.14